MSDHDQNATYPIAFVRGLEGRIRDPEGRLAASATSPASRIAPSSSAIAGNVEGTAGDAVMPEAPPMGFATTPLGGPAAPERQHLGERQDEPAADLPPRSGPTTPSQCPAGYQTHCQPQPQPRAHGMPGSFVEQLKIISLEATAERHLGSSSGLSFARLTHMVLRRLTPDKADFVFGTGGDEEEEDEERMGEFRPSSQSQQSSNLDPQLQTVDSGFGSGMGAGLNINMNTDFTHPSPSFFFSDAHFPFDLNLQSPGSSGPALFGSIALHDIMDDSAGAVEGLSLPADSAHVDSLVDFYFAHSHTLYPIVRRSEIMSLLGDARAAAIGGAIAPSPPDLFKVWMVLAIGSTAYCSVTLEDESESMLYYNKALTYFEAALAYGDTAALEVLTLQVSYSFFNQLGPNTWFLVGMAARIAIGMGIHSSSTYKAFTVDEAERRKRLFFSIYMMDRVVSVALGRPFALHDDDIDVSPFADVDDDDITPTGIRPRQSLQLSLMAVPLHILALRRIASKIASQVYSPRLSSSPPSPLECEATVRTLHEELISWRRNMPFPLPTGSASFARVPHLSNSWYDFNYYTHVAMLYRPSPLLPTPSQERVHTLHEATSMALRTAMSMHMQHRLAYNWLNFLGVYTATLSLIYSITAQPDDLALVIQRTRGCDDLEDAIKLFETLSVKFRPAKRVSRMVKEIVERYKTLCMNNDQMSGNSCI
ncbi:uncharacterized protein JN550_005731 [Neoarthrinium moseri]|uniref:uncharacterized protein n=1 Tax=Neoarthrinium moseri TaxID=1658444 RepID=UPI001FDC65EE|nr:uncharacterized protein JN550_005731 [Neoarthrinium moseri]KAI1869750.1 hypothetical protein JN550_005731 [Neoarthrinium moseri]